MSRFNAPDSFNSGNVAAGGGTLVINRTIPRSLINLAKIKIVPSGSSVGYLLEIFKHATCLLVDRQYSTRDRLQTNAYDPTDRTGNEELEGWVLPYEDLDAANQLHIKLTNYDAVIRTYQLTLTYEDYLASALSGLTPAEAVTFTGAAGSLSVAATAAANIRLYRNGSRLRQGAGVGYTVAGNKKDLTLTVPNTGGEYFEAEYF